MTESSGIQKDDKTLRMILCSFQLKNNSRESNVHGVRGLDIEIKVDMQSLLSPQTQTNFTVKCRIKK